MLIAKNVLIFKKIYLHQKCIRPKHFVLNESELKILFNENFEIHYINISNPGKIS